MDERFFLIFFFFFGGGGGGGGGGGVWEEAKADSRHKRTRVITPQVLMGLTCTCASICMLRNFAC